MSTPSVAISTTPQGLPAFRSRFIVKVTYGANLIPNQHCCGFSVSSRHPFRARSCSERGLSRPTPRLRSCQTTHRCRGRCHLGCHHVRRVQRHYQQGQEFSSGLLRGAGRVKVMTTTILNSDQERAALIAAPESAAEAGRSAAAPGKRTRSRQSFPLDPWN